MVGIGIGNGDIKYYVHSKCCKAHWELVMREDGSCDLVCERCGKPVGPEIIIHTTVTDAHCELCNEEPSKTRTLYIAALITFAIVLVTLIAISIYMLRK